MLRLIERPGRHAFVRVAPSARAIVSWNAGAPSGTLVLTAHRVDARVSGPLPFARWSPDERRSLNGADAAARIDTDVVRSDVQLTAIAIESSVELEAAAVSVPPPERAAIAGAVATALDVPCVSQFDPSEPDQRGWCSAAAVAMLLRYHGVDATLREVVRGSYDAAYGGTGNWPFSTAYAGTRGMLGVAAFLDGIDQAAAFVAAGLPVAISIAWEPGTLRGAALDRSDGHLVVVRGVEPDRVAVNDPAHPRIAVHYARTELDRAFRAHGGVAYLIAPHPRTAELVALANA